MKKILFTLFVVAALAVTNRSEAQCSGGNVTISNFTLIPALQQVNYNFDWQYVQGNASIEVAFLCNGTQVGSLPCIPWLKDSIGLKNVSGTFPTTCAGTFRMEIRIWTNNNCGGTYCVSSFREIDNIPLPVSFKSFTATRNRSAVLLKWETASEINNSGFAVERNNSGAWEQVAWVPTQAAAGNSDVPVSYTYTDMNTTRGISQYRIRQVDIDSRATYSEIRSVRGENQLAKTLVYPNPSSDGRVNIMFEDASASRDVLVSDMSGRIIRQMKGVTANAIQIENLVPGMYILRITDVATGEQAVEKIVVNKR